MKSVHFPIRDEMFGYRLARKETNSVLRAKYLAELLIREVSGLSSVLWVTERETYIRYVGHKMYPNGDLTGEYNRDIVILGSVQFGENVESVEVEIKMSMSRRSAKATYVTLYRRRAFSGTHTWSVSEASVLPNGQDICRTQ